MLIHEIKLPNLLSMESDIDYVRPLNSKARISVSEKNIAFDKGGRVSFDTKKNLINIKEFKSHHLIVDPKILIAGEGNFLIRFGIHRPFHPHKWLQEDELSISSTNEACIHLSFWHKIDEGLLYMTVEGLGKGGDKGYIPLL